MKKYVTPEIVIAKLSSEDIMSISLPFVPINQGFFGENNEENNFID